MKGVYMLKNRRPRVQNVKKVGNLFVVVFEKSGFERIICLLTEETKRTHPRQPRLMTLSRHWRDRRYDDTRITFEMIQIRR
jgi:hypothetical protein